jgi:hypothetical protein
MMSNSVPIEVVDKSVKLSCGCVVVYMRGNLDKGQMFLCRQHLKEYPFTSLEIVARVAEGIRQGKTTFSIRGRD